MKTRWQLVSGDEAAALIKHGKYHPGQPFWIRYYTDKEGKTQQYDGVYVRIDENFAKWRESFGNRLKALEIQE